MGRGRRHRTEGSGRGSQLMEIACAPLCHRPWILGGQAALCDRPPCGKGAGKTCGQRAGVGQGEKRKPGLNLVFLGNQGHPTTPALSVLPPLERVGARVSLEERNAPA